MDQKNTQTNTMNAMNTNTPITNTSNSSSSSIGSSIGSSTGGSGSSSSSGDLLMEVMTNQAIPIPISLLSQSSQSQS